MVNKEGRAATVRISVCGFSNMYSTITVIQIRLVSQTETEPGRRHSARMFQHSMFLAKSIARPSGIKSTSVSFRLRLQSYALWRPFSAASMQRESTCRPDQYHIASSSTLCSDLNLIRHHIFFFQYHAHHKPTRVACATHVCCNGGLWFRWLDQGMSNYLRKTC